MLASSGGGVICRSVTGLPTGSSARGGAYQSHPPGGSAPAAWHHVRASVARAVIVCDVDGPFGLIEFPADDPDRARRFWSGLLGIELAERSQAEGRGWQTKGGAPVLGVHERGAGPGDTASLPYFTVADMQAALDQVTALGGSVIHPGTRWSICSDSEGSPFGLADPSGS